MQKLQKGIAFLFLFLLIFISVPRDFVHHCEAVHTQKASLPAAEFSSKCEVCNFELIQHNTAASISVPAPVIFIIPRVHINVPHLPTARFIFISNKAPPAFQA